MFLRIGSAETDEQLEVVLGKFLAPVLLKLNSSEEVVRKKVFDLTTYNNNCNVSMRAHYFLQPNCMPWPYRRTPAFKLCRFYFHKLLVLRLVVV